MYLKASPISRHKQAPKAEFPWAQWILMAWLYKCIASVKCSSNAGHLSSTQFFSASKNNLAASVSASTSPVAFESVFSHLALARLQKPAYCGQSCLFSSLARAPNWLLDSETLGFLRKRLFNLEVMVRYCPKTSNSRSMAKIWSFSSWPFWCQPPSTTRHIEFYPAKVAGIAVESRFSRPTWRTPRAQNLTVLK